MLRYYRMVSCSLNERDLPFLFTTPLLFSVSTFWIFHFSLKKSQLSVWKSLIVF